MFIDTKESRRGIDCGRKGELGSENFFDNFTSLIYFIALRFIRALNYHIYCALYAAKCLSKKKLSATLGPSYQTK
jgi:hypothetical protein